MKASTLILLFIAAWAVCACKPEAPVQASTPPPPAKPALQPVKLGVFLPLSGDQASFGNDAINGARLAVEELNQNGGVLGRPLEIVLRDTASDAATIPGIVKDLTGKEGVPLLIGEVASARSIEAAGVAQSLGIPMISPASTHRDVTAAGEFVFRTCYAEPSQGAAMARFAASVRATKAAILTETANPYSQELAKSFRDSFLASGGEIAADIAFTPGSEDFKSIMEEIRAKGAEVIFLPSYYPEAAPLIRQARLLGIDMPFLGGDGWDSPEFLKQAGSAVENCYQANHFSAQQDLPEVQTFVKAYEARFGAPPPPLAALTYDAVKVGAAAIATAGSENRDAIRDALAATSEFPGVTGKITLGPDRTPAKPTVILRAEQGKFNYLETVAP